MTWKDVFQGVNPDTDKAIDQIGQMGTRMLKMGLAGGMIPGVPGIDSPGAMAYLYPSSPPAGNSKTTVVNQNNTYHINGAQSPKSVADEIVGNNKALIMRAQQGVVW